MREDVLIEAPVQGDQQFLCEMAIPEESQVVQSLVGLNGSSGVCTPGQVLIQMN